MTRKNKMKPVCALLIVLSCCVASLNAQVPMTGVPDLTPAEPQDGQQQPMIECPWASNLIGVNGTECIDYLDQEAGARFKWKVYCALFPTIFFLMALVFAYDLARLCYIWYCNDDEIHPLANASAYTFGACCISCILMGAACIDGWALFRIYTPAIYLGLYAIPYGSIIPAAIGIPSIHLMDTLVIRPILEKSGAKYTIGSLIFTILVVLYGTVGYSIYGFILSAEISKNPATQLGIAGNKLQYTSLALALFIIVFCMIPVVVNINNMIKELSRVKRKQSTSEKQTTTETYRFSKQSNGSEMKIEKTSNDLEKELKKRSEKVQSWMIRQFLACAFLLAYMIANDYVNKDGGLLATLDMLLMCRIVELILLVNTHDLLNKVGNGDSKYIELIPFQLFFKFISKLPCCTGLSVALEKYESDHATATSTRRNGSTTELKTLTPKGPKNSFHSTTSNDVESFVADEDVIHEMPVIHEIPVTVVSNPVDSLQKKKRRHHT